MVAITFEYEVCCSVPAARMFKALILDGNVVPKALPKGVKSIEIHTGEGGAVYHLITFAEGNSLKSTKERIDGVDKDNFTYNYTTVGVEGGSDSLKEVIESCTNTVKIVPSADGGSICKASCTYNTKGDAQVTEEQVRGKERVTFMFKNIEEYLVAHPHLYN